MSKTIKEILMTRDNMSESEAIRLIQNAKNSFYYYLDIGDEESAENTCKEFFGLESDYLDELIYQSFI